MNNITYIIYNRLIDAFVTEGGLFHLLLASTRLEAKKSSGTSMDGHPLSPEQVVL
jgi:hypothetical protein